MTALTITLSGVDITTKVDMTTVMMQLAGSQEIATCEFDITDDGLTVNVPSEALLTVTEVGTAEVLFGGFVRSRRIIGQAHGRTIHVAAVDYNSLLDRSIVISDSRSAGESDHARLVYLMTTYGSQLSSDYTQIATLKASMPAQKFVAKTLRQAIEQVLGQASYLSSYFCDPTGRLVTYDRSIVTAAPFDVHVTLSPGVGEIAPDSFDIDLDTSNLANAVYVIGATAAGSGWRTDATSISAYGRRERFFNAPDSDTSAKATQVGLAVLQDGKNPIPRGTFVTQSPNDGWRIGQSVTVTSTQHGLSAVVYRVARVTVHYLTGAGQREYTIEIGAPQATLSSLLGAIHGGGGSGGTGGSSGGGWGGWVSPPGGGGGWGCSCCCGGTGGASGCDPGMTDDFQRTATSDIGAFASSGGAYTSDSHWATAAGAATLTLTAGHGNLASLYGIGWFSEVEILVTMTTADGALANDKVNLGLDTLLDFVELDLAADGTLNFTTGSDNLTLMSDFGVGQQWKVKLAIDRATHHGTAKAWPASRAEPAGWMFTSAAPLAGNDLGADMYFGGTTFSGGNLVADFAALGSAQVNNDTLGSGLIDSLADRSGSGSWNGSWTVVNGSSNISIGVDPKGTFDFPINNTGGHNYESTLRLPITGPDPSSTYFELAFEFMSETLTAASRVSFLFALLTQAGQVPNVAGPACAQMSLVWTPGAPTTLDLNFFVADDAGNSCAVAVDPLIPWTPGRPLGVKLHVDGNGVLRVKVWDVGDPEPVGYTAYNDPTCATSVADFYSQLLTGVAGGHVSLWVQADVIGANSGADILHVAAIRAADSVHPCGA